MKNVLEVVCVPSTGCQQLPISFNFTHLLSLEVYYWRKIVFYTLEVRTKFHLEFFRAHFIIFTASCWGTDGTSWKVAERQGKWWHESLLSALERQGNKTKPQHATWTRELNVKKLWWRVEGLFSLLLYVNFFDLHSNEKWNLHEV